MIQHIKAPLFKEDTSVQVDISKNIDDEDTCVQKNLEAKMDNTLSRAKKLSTCHASTSMASIHGMARKKSVCMQQHFGKYFISAQI